jgi:hypothetical protein
MPRVHRDRQRQSPAEAQSETGLDRPVDLLEPFERAPGLSAELKARDDRVAGGDSKRL